MKLRGSVSFRDIETGIWVLQGDDGQTYELAGGDRAIKKDGKRIEVEGDVDGDAATIGMTGPLLRVKRYRFL
jgi:cob(I)alamin adenosyltransferase